MSLRLYVAVFAILAPYLVAGGVMHARPGIVVSREIVDATILPADFSQAGRSTFSICGEATTINNNTIYYEPSLTLAADTSGGQKCDINAVGNATETSADNIVFTNQAFAVLGMTCRNEGDANADISFTLRAAAADVSPSVRCVIADGDRECVANEQTTTNVAASALISLAATSTGDIPDANGFNCHVEVAF